MKSAHWTQRALLSKWNMARAEKIIVTGLSKWLNVMFRSTNKQASCRNPLWCVFAADSDYTIQEGPAFSQREQWVHQPAVYLRSLSLWLISLLIALRPETDTSEQSLMTSHTEDSHTHMLSHVCMVTCSYILQFLHNVAFLNYTKNIPTNMFPHILSAMSQFKGEVHIFSSLSIYSNAECSLKELIFIIVPTASAACEESLINVNVSDGGQNPLSLFRVNIHVHS